jgi:hypothetical protein
VGWWHWLSNTWLISDANGNLKASFLRDNVVEIFNKEHAFVIEIRKNDDTWSGFGPNTEEKDMFKWINENWKKD